MGTFYTALNGTSYPRGSARRSAERADRKARAMMRFDRVPEHDLAYDDAEGHSTYVAPKKSTRTKTRKDGTTYVTTNGNPRGRCACGCKKETRKRAPRMMRVGNVFVDEGAPYAHYNEKNHGEVLS